MSTDDRNVEIRMDRIPVRGGIGAVLTIIVLLGAMVLELEGLRVPAIVGLVGGVLIGCILILWRRCCCLPTDRQATHPAGLIELRNEKSL